jgi:ribosomal protein S18 acetylase RimI-like enzyme
LEADGGRLKLEWPSLRQRPAGRTNDVVFDVGGQMLGFLGIYQWRALDAELCGMVHPSWRRQGIGEALYEAAREELITRAPARTLLIVDRASVPGKSFALDHGGELEHSEHRMQQRREPDERNKLTPVRVRPARRSAEDALFAASCLAAAFDESLSVDPQDAGAVEQLASGTQIIELLPSGRPVGVLRIENEGGAASIYGFAVLPEEQGHGYGRAALSAVTRSLHRQGVGSVSLEVLSTNDSALHLYRTCGFDAVGTEDYYAMPI